MPSGNTSLPLAQFSTHRTVFFGSLPLNSRIWRHWPSSSAVYAYLILVVQCGYSWVLFDQASFGLTPNGQIWPRALNVDIGGVTGAIYLIVGDLGSESGFGLDFINGQAFLERFYSVFDTANKRVGLATTPFTSATTNWDIMITIRSMRFFFFQLTDIVKNFWNQYEFFGSTFI